MSNYNCSICAYLIPTGFGNTFYAILGFGQFGADAATTASRVCLQARRSEGNHEEPLALEVGESVAKLLNSTGSIAILCASGREPVAMQQMGAIASQLSGPAHSVIVITDDGDYYRMGNHSVEMALLCQTADILGVATGLATAVACRGSIGLDLSDIRLALSGFRQNVAFYASGQMSPADLAIAILERVADLRVDIPTIQGMLICVVVGSHWNLEDVDALLQIIWDTILPDGCNICTAWITDKKSDASSVTLALAC